MKYRYHFLMLIIVMLALSLAACTRSANSQASSVTEPTATTAGVGQPTTDNVMGQLEQFVTQTAMATMGTGAQPTSAIPTTAPPEGGTDGDLTSTASAVEPSATPGAPEPSATPAPTDEPAPTAITVPTATPGIPSSYTLHGGEHVYCISRRFNVNPNEVLQVNGMGSGSLVYAGMTLKLPQTGNPFPGNRSLQNHPTTFTVKQGDTIYSIACEFGDVDPYAIAYANGLTEPYKVSAGQKLNIP